MNIDVVGMDPSMTSTGISVNGVPFRVRSAPKKLPPGKKQQPWRERFDRLDRIVETVCDYVPLGSIVIYEGPSYASKGSSSHDIAGTWWSIARELQRERQAHILVAAPATRMKYATGKGVADKDMVLAAAVKRYPDIDITGNDVADATLFYAIGKRLLGKPIEATLPVANLKALDTLMEDWREISREMGL